MKKSFVPPVSMPKVPGRAWKQLDVSPQRKEGPVLVQVIEKDEVKAWEKLIRNTGLEKTIRVVPRANEFKPGAGDRPAIVAEDPAKVKKLLEKARETGLMEKRSSLADCVRHIANQVNLQEWLKEVATNDISPKDAMEIYKAYEIDGADTEHSVAKVTGIDAWTCKKVLDIAMKYGLLK